MKNPAATGSNGPVNNSMIIAILHQAANQLIAIEKEGMIYQIMGQTIAKILPGVLIFVTKLQPDDMNFRIVESFGFDKYFNAIKKILGKDPFTIDFPFDELSNNQITAFESGRIHRFPGGIHDLTRGRINRVVSKSIEKMLGIGNICAISFCVEKKYFGGITLFIPKSAINSGFLNAETEMAIETLAYQASFAIQKLRDRSSLLKNAEILQLTNLQIETLFENSSTGFLFEDVSRKIIKVNQSFCTMFGIPDPEKLTGLDCKTAGKQSAGLFIDHEGFLCDVENLIKEGKSCFYQELVTCDGRTLERDFIPVRNNSIVGYLWQYRDVSHRKRSELELLISQTRFRQLTNQLNDILWMANADGSEMVDLNNSFEKYYGLPVSEFDKNPNLWIDIIHPEDRKIAKESEVELFETGNTIVEYRIVRPDGKIIWLHDRKSIIYDKSGTPIQMGGVATDITEVKKLEQMLQEQARRLEELNSIKDKFFSIIAHDLKGPFNSILGFSDHLATGYNDLTDELRIKFIHTLNESAHNFYYHLDDLLEWARIQRESIEMHKEVFDLKSLVFESIAPYQSNAANKGVAVSIAIPEGIRINVDSHSLKVVFGNLFNNAIKFTITGGNIEFEAHVKNDHAEVRIIDSGIGMSPEQIDKLFRLEETHSTPGTNNEKGTGLGLILCKEFLAKNDSDLWVESEVGKGSIFTVSIPILV